MGKNIKSANKSELDSQGEIVFEIKHNLIWWNYCGLIFCILIGVIMMFSATNAINDYDKLSEKIVALCFLLCGIFLICLPLKDIFYQTKNRFYITDKGICFERRNWFKIQKRFFIFGEIGVTISSSSSLNIFSSTYFFYIFPLGHKGVDFKNIYFFSISSWNKTYLSPKIYNEITEQSFLYDFLVQKTKESLISKDIDIDSLPYDLENQFRFV
ncbi:hypothetical protein [Helicobacter sp. T3_23-1056]